jgi:ribosomal-protein-alanine N-acetyltransferase
VTRPPAARLRPVVSADLAALVALEAASFPDPWPAAALRSELAEPSSRLWVAELPAATAGPPSAPPLLVGYGAFRRVADEAELLRLAVRPGQRRAGLGRAVLEHGLDRLAVEGVRLCFLEVRTDNAAALHLYAAAGFERGGLRPGYYRDGAPALLMTRSLP